MKKLKIGPVPDRSASKINKVLSSYLEKSGKTNKVSLTNIAKQLGERREKVLSEDGDE